MTWLRRERGASAAGLAERRQRAHLRRRERSSAKDDAPPRLLGSPVQTRDYNESRGCLSSDAPGKARRRRGKPAVKLSDQEDAAATSGRVFSADGSCHALLSVLVKKKQKPWYRSHQQLDQCSQCSQRLQLNQT